MEFYFKYDQIIFKYICKENMYPESVGIKYSLRNLKLKINYNHV
jgi:hypothetical protein